MIVSKETNKLFIRCLTGFSGLNQFFHNIIQFFGNMAKTETVLYDLSVNGEILTSATLDTGLKLPLGAVIKSVTINVLTNVDSASDTATLALSFADADTEEGAGTIATGLTQANLQKGSYNVTTTSVVLKADSNLLLKAGTEKITAGKFRIFVDYYLNID